MGVFVGDNVFFCWVGVIGLSFGGDVDFVDFVKDEDMEEDDEYDEVWP